jgi:hypothetical protein
MSANNNNSNDQPKMLSRSQKRHFERRLGHFSSIDCKIELDRNNRVYFPGDVVTGRVRLQVPPSSVDQQQFCRGVYWEFLGKSTVLWVQGGSGDSPQVILAGYTFFQNEHRTLLGKYHRSMFVRGNEHVMVIACNRQQRQQYLVLQPVSIDRLQKEKVLGEILVDLKDFDGSSGPRSYPLLINKQKTEIILSGVWETESLHSHDDESQHFRLCVHQLEGFQGLFAHLRVHLSAEASLPKQDRSVDNDEILPQGETVFPFRFKLGEDSPGSANWLVSGIAFVRFEVKARIDMKLARKDRGPASLVLLTVLSNHPKPLPALLPPFHAEKLDQIMHSCHCLRSGKQDGLVSVRLALSRLAFAPGEAIDLMGSQATNDASSALPLRVILRCYIERRHSSDPKSIPNKVRHDFVLLEAEVPGKQTVFVDSLVGSSVIRIPAVFPSFDGGVEQQEADSVAVADLPSNRFACLKWSYTLEIRVGGNKGDWATGIYCRTPILICAAPPHAAQVEAARSEHPNLQELMGPMSIFEYAATCSEDCDTTPALGGPEDGGTLVVAEQSGIHVTGETHQVRELLQHQLEWGQWQKSDWEPFCNRAIVYSFDPGATPAVELHESQGTFETSADVPSQSMLSAQTESSNQPVGSTTSGILDLDGLLRAMEDSPDNRAIVHDWIQSHPGKANQLLPQHVAAIVSRVSFSLDRMEILKELVTAVNKQSALTCEHILAVMEVCPFEKAEVARLMAPSVNDPENKELVLNQIEWQLEREAVDRLFPSRRLAE